ncbi:DUF7661 family protein [Vibrio mimicus]
MSLKFNVFGKIMSVFRESGEWFLYVESDAGIRCKVYDVVIPADLDETELSTYLDDIYHEMASAKYPSVFKL